MPYSDPNLTHNPATGAVAPAAWGDVVRDDLEFLIDPPASSVFNSAAQSVANNTQTVLTANSENFDNDAMHSTVTNTSRLTATTAGRYLAIATVGFNADVDGRRALSFLINGTTVLVGQAAYPVQEASQRTIITVARAITLAATDYVETRCIHTAGAALDVTLEEFAITYLTR